MTDIRIVMVDDHGLFRESLGRLLEGIPQLKIVGRCANAAAGLDFFSKKQADVVLLDYDLGEETALALLRQLKDNWKSLKILMVTAGMSDDVTLQVMEAGASGIFLKHDDPDQLITAIERIYAGEVWLDEKTLQSLVTGRQSRKEAVERSSPLTERQIQVLRGILDGLANKEIAWKLKTSETSVKAVIQELFRKAGVRTRSQLVRIAIEKHSSDWLEARS
jgi:two-component system, NarL family, nitrate/nitrite response regulator NarL